MNLNDLVSLLIKAYFLNISSINWAIMLKMPSNFSLLKIIWSSLVVLSSDQGLCSSDHHISCLTWPKACQWQPCPRNLWKLKKSCFEGCLTAFQIDSWICFLFQFIAKCCSESILFLCVLVSRARRLVWSIKNVYKSWIWKSQRPQHVDRRPQPKSSAIQVRAKAEPT